VFYKLFCKNPLKHGFPASYFIFFIAILQKITTTDSHNLFTAKGLYQFMRLLYREYRPKIK